MAAKEKGAEQWPELLTVDEVAEMFKVSTRSVRRWATDEELPVFKVGQTLRFPKQDLLEWLRNRVKVRGDGVQGRKREAGL